MLGVAKAFDLLKPDEILYPGKPGCPITSTRVSDHEWLKVAGENDWIVFTRDKHMPILQPITSTTPRHTINSRPNKTSKTIKNL